MQYKSLLLDRFQEEAIAAIDRLSSLVVSAPTGSGKTVIAEYAIDKAVALGRSIIYTAPIKALSNQKYRDFSRDYKDKVGIMTGDVTINSQAPILIMTTEIFRNSILETPDRFADALYIIFDEVHFLDDQERGTVWEESIIFSPKQIKVACFSATIPNLEQLTQWIETVREEPVCVVRETQRPVPLEEWGYLGERGMVKVAELAQHFPAKKKQREMPTNGYLETWEYNPQVFWQNADALIDHVISEKHLPCLYFTFSRKECESLAMRNGHRFLLAPPQRVQSAELIAALAARYQVACAPDDKQLGSLLVRGIGYHHAGMLPSLKEIVEVLFTKGLIKLLFATETFAMGINMPASAVVFNALKKFDGIGTRYLKAIEYQQMSGRAGRRGMDPVGYVYTSIARDDLSAQFLQRIFAPIPEPITSQFNLSYSTILNLYRFLKEDIYQACDKSFGTFCQKMENRASGNKTQDVRKAQRKTIKQKLGILVMLGYIRGGELTSKGKFAAQLHGHEIPLTELFFGGVLESIDVIGLFGLAVSLTYEGKKPERFNKALKARKVLIQAASEPIIAAHKLEKMAGLKEEIKLPDFRLLDVAENWMKGQSFAEFMKRCPDDEGDVVRVFRMAIQLLRQLKKACQGYDYFETLLDQCMDLANRDEINAAKNLQVDAS